MEGDGRRLETHGSHATRWPRASTGISSKVSGRAKQVKDSGATFIVINHRQRVIVNVEFQPVAHVLGESILHRPLFFDAAWGAREPSTLSHVEVLQHLRNTNFHPDQFDALVATDLYVQPPVSIPRIVRFDLYAHTEMVFDSNVYT